MEKKLSRQQIKSILDHEARKTVKEGILNLEETKEYLTIIANEMSTWTNLNYISYWQCESGSQIIK